jgi:hypothetical protein
MRQGTPKVQPSVSRTAAIPGGDHNAASAAARRSQAAVTIASLA